MSASDPNDDGICGAEATHSVRCDDGSYVSMCWPCVVRYRSEDRVSEFDANTDNPLCMALPEATPPATPETDLIEIMDQEDEQAGRWPGLKPNEHPCHEMAAFRYTWEGNQEAFACTHHAAGIYQFKDSGAPVVIEKMTDDPNCARYQCSSIVWDGTEPEHEPESFEATVSALVKLASLVVHYEELNSPTGHGMDANAIKGLRDDPEVVSLMDALKAAGLLPVKR